MPERVETESGGLREGLRDGVREMREDVSREKVESRLDDAISERPLVKRMLDLRILAKALLIAAVLTLIAALLLSVKLAALVLVVSFGIAWVALASRDYNTRRRTEPVET